MATSDTVLGRQMASSQALARLLLLSFVLAAPFGCARQPPAAPTKIEAAGLHNVLRITDRLYCGSEPEGDRGFESLKKLGIKTVVSVDGAKPDLTRAKADGLRYVHIPTGYSGISPQAQAALLEIARRIGKNDEIDVRGGDFGAPKAFGDYGLVYTTVTFECHIEQFVNFLSDLSREPELVVPSEERIASGNPKEKTMNVRMVLAGVVAKKLVPEKKGLAAF